MGLFVKIAKSGDIQPGQGRMFEASGKKIALFNVDGFFYAIDNTCIHVPIGVGRLPNGVNRPLQGAYECR